MIVVTTPTGQIGGQLAAQLLDAGERIRVIARDPARLAAGIRDRAEVVVGSHGDPAVLDEALAGAAALFWVVPPDPRVEDLAAAYVGFTRAAAAAVTRHRVGHVVDVTVLGRGTRWQGGAGLVTASLEMDDLLAATGAAQRGLASPGFMDNMLMQVEPIRTQGMVFGPVAGGRKLPQVATRDIAAVAARLLTDRGWRGQENLPVLGPADLSFDDMAATMSEVLGRTVRYQQVPFDAFEGRLRERGASAEFARGFIAMMRAKDEGMDNAAPRTPEATTHTTFRAWCETVLKPAVAG